MKAPKAMTIRLSPDQAEALEFVAAVDNSAIADVIRVAINNHIEHRKQDQSFQVGLADRIERAQKLFTK